MAAGRISVESIVCSQASRWKPLGVATDRGVVSFAAWVDNYYTFGNSFHNAIHSAEYFEAELFGKWDLKIKPSSRSVMSPMQSDADWDCAKWPRVVKADILGHLVSSDASPWPCWRLTETAMWRAFWGNCVGPCTHGLCVRERCKLLDRSVRPVLQFRNTRWPFTQSIANQQNRVQRQMLSHFIKIERVPCEEVGNYNRRRMRAIGVLARQHGTWGSDHAKRVVEWAEHLERPRNQDSLASMLYAWRGPAWLHNRRIESGVMRPATRALPGYLPKRWDEAIEDARGFSTAQY